MATITVLASAGGLVSGSLPVTSAGAPERSAQLLQRSFESRALSGVEHYAISLPAGYDNGRRRYPVIYALHGLPAGPDAYRRMPIAAWGRAADAAGRPAIVVSPQGGRQDDTDPEWHDWGPGRDWETAVERDLRRDVDRHFRTFRERRGRAIIGVSAGGYGASIIGVRHPDAYSVIQSWSGYFHPTNPSGDAPLTVGSPDQDEAASVHSYVARARKIYAAKPTSLGFFVGDEDPHFLPENEQLHRELLAAGVDHGYAVYPGAHNAAFWAEHEGKWVATASRFLRRAR